MATALFISTQDLKKNSIIDGNVDIDKMLQFVKVAQQIDIQNLLGTDLYNKISEDIIADNLTGDYLTLVNTYVQPCLIWFSQMNYIPFAAYTITNKSVLKHSSETAQNVDKNEVDYLCFNNNLFPEYNSNTNEDISPDTDTTFNGWVL